MLRAKKDNPKDERKRETSRHGSPYLPMRSLFHREFGFFHYVVVKFTKDFKEIFSCHNAKPLSVRNDFNCFRVRSSVLDTVPGNISKSFAMEETESAYQ